MKIDSDSLAVISSNCDNRLLSGNALQAIGFVLRGHLKIGGSTLIELRPGQILVTEPERTLHLRAPRKAIWLAIVGTSTAWYQHLSKAHDSIENESLLLPATYATNQIIKRLVLSLARADSIDAQTAIVNAIIRNILELQLRFGDLIERCPGRTHAQRRQVFLRLQRAHKFISENFTSAINSQHLARMTNYSVCHFIRAFGAVYQETPHSFLLRKRLENAKSLLRESRYSILEIAQASGFQSASVFSRKFRQFYGVTAGMMRRETAVTGTCVQHSD